MDIFFLQESIMTDENIPYVQQSCHFLFESLVDLLEKAPSQPCKVAIADTMAVIGNLLHRNDPR